MIHTSPDFRLAIEAAPNGMLVVNRDGVIVLANRRAESLFGYESGELTGQRIETLVPERFREAHPTLARSVLHDGEARPRTVERDLHGRRKDGGELIVAIGLNPFETPEGRFVLSSVDDITERRRVEAQLRASLREKEVLLKEVHHRVKNNLQVISSLLNLQALHLDDATVRAMFEQSRGRVQSIALVHEQLYRASDLTHVPFDDYLRSLSTSLGSAHGIAFEGVQLDLDLAPVRLAIDLAVPCGLMVTELITNALRHAFVGREGGLVRVALATAGDTVQVTVADDGVGLPADFDPRASSTLGLDLVFTFAEQLDADVRVEREGGTSFHITFRSPPEC